MADAVVRLFTDAEERHRLGHSARENVLRHFTWADVAERLDALLRL
jgi:glycosyltransferase involved in cell wall biosynthesis